MRPSPQKSAATRSPGRHARRRERTRTQLVDAARKLFARQGIDNTRINEITDVGFGSFYNHFESKEAIVDAVLAEAVAAQGEAIDAATAELDDPAEVVAAAHRSLLNLARSDPDWGWLVVRLDLSLSLRALGPFARRDLERGIKAGRFEVPNKRVALFAMGGALLGVMRDVLDGQAPRDADRHHAEGVLRMLGLTAVDAAEVARRPLPEVPRT
jgi:AcrR family transcriptional regulator